MPLDHQSAVHEFLSSKGMVDPLALAEIHSEMQNANFSRN